jgi:DNA-binding MarR family transcriptional regulator
VIRLNESEQKVLRYLVEHFSGVGWCLPFSPIVRDTGLDRKAVRRACRSLARKGLAQYERGLWDDERPAGAGYCATEKGVERVAVQ